MEPPPVLLLGAGVREHAIGEKLAGGGVHLHVVARARNPALAKLAEEYLVGDESDPALAAEAARKWGVLYAISGPVEPVAAGVIDALMEAGVYSFSPDRAGGRIETDKLWMRRVRHKHVSGLVERWEAFDRRGGPFADGPRSNVEAWIREIGEAVVKPVAPTGGGGVKATGEELRGAEEAAAYAREVIARDGRVLIEHKEGGEEFTLACFADGFTAVPMPFVHVCRRERAAYTDADGRLPFLSPEDCEWAKSVMGMLVRGMARERVVYRGVISGRFMATAHGPMLLGVDARFGTLEATNLLALLLTPLEKVGDWMERIDLDEKRGGVHFGRRATVSRLVSCGSVDEEAVRRSGARLHRGADDGVVLLGVGDTLEHANEQVERALAGVGGSPCLRRDVGTAGFVSRQVAHMQELRKRR